MRNVTTLRLVPQESASAYRTCETDKEGIKPDSLENNGLETAKVCPDIHSGMSAHTFGRWIRSDRDFFALMLKIDLPRQERRVLDALMFKVRFGNFVELSRNQIAGLTGMQGPNISSAMARLVELDVVVRIKRGQYLLNPLYCYMGEGDGRANMIGRYYSERGKQGLGRKARRRGPYFFVGREMTHHDRRASDHNGILKFFHRLRAGFLADPSPAVILGAVGLYLWAFFGWWMFQSDFEAYVRMFPVGNGFFWLASYIGVATACFFLVGLDYPPFLSLITACYMVVVWSWAALARMTQVATYQTGNATSIVYITLALVILYHSARKNARAH